MSKPGVWEGVEGAAAEGSPIVPCRWQPLPPGCILGGLHPLLAGGSCNELPWSQQNYSPTTPTNHSCTWKLF